MRQRPGTLTIGGTTINSALNHQDLCTISSLVSKERREKAGRFHFIEDSARCVIAGHTAGSV